MFVDDVGECCVGFEGEWSVGECGEEVWYEVVLFFCCFEDMGSGGISGFCGFEGEIGYGLVFDIGCFVVMVGV